MKLKHVYLGGLMDESAEKPAQQMKVRNHWNVLNLNPGAFTKMK